MGAIEKVSQDHPLSIRPHAFLERASNGISHERSKGITSYDILRSFKKKMKACANRVRSGSQEDKNGEPRTKRKGFEPKRNKAIDRTGTDDSI